MEQSEPPETGGAGSDAPGGAYDALRRIEERLDRASDAAERLIADAMARAAGTPSDAESGSYGKGGGEGGGVGRAEDSDEGGGEGSGVGRADTAEQPSEPAGDAYAAPNDSGRHKPPPAGWQTPPSAEEGRAGTELELLANILQSLRELIPPELQRRLAEALRELLLALRALIDWYLERVEQRRRTPAEVQDIPIL